MPEGHTVHRHARQHLRTFGAQTLEVSSPQGRFAAGAARLDGRVLTAGQAHGKHLFLGFADRPGDRADAWLHVHLGLYGTWTFGSLVTGAVDADAPDDEADGADDYTYVATARGVPPEPRGAVRVRLVGDDAWADLRGPTACEVLTTDDVAAVRARLGADPLRRDADHATAGSRIRRSRAPLGALLMQQDVVAGIGNVYRAEALFRARLDPWAPGRQLDEGTWEALWSDLVGLLRDGVRRGRIVTTLPGDRTRRSGTVRREDAYYVYRRAGLPCRICGTAVVTEPMVGRNLFRCPVCQAA